MSEVKTDKLSPRTDSGTTTLGDSGDTFLVNTGAKIDINGTELILDADADTSITSDTDDQIDIRIAGADDFQFTANTFTALSGSTISIASGAVLSLDDGAVATPALTNTGDLNTGIYFPAADTVGVTAGGTEQFGFGSNPIPGGSKNLIINGAMTVNQRGISALALDGANQYTVDRWRVQEASSAGVIQVNQSSTVPAGAGFASSLHVDVTTADSSLAAGDYVLIYQSIEAQNLQHLAYGNAAAKSLTLSFWVRSPKSGTHAVGIYQSDGSRHYIREYTVTSADTWQHITVTFPGDASGTINNDAGGGLDVYFGLATGSTYQNTADTWAAAQDWSTSSAVNCVDDAANNFYLTGVQLEVGDVATDYAHEDYGTTLIKCQRYYEQMEPSGSGYNLPGTYNCFIATTSTGQGFFQWNVEKRAAPTIDMIAATDWIFVKTSGSNNYSGGEMTASAFTFSQIKTNHCWFLITTSSTGGTAGASTWIQSTGANHKVTISAEL